MADIKARFAHASVIDSERVVFNIGGNKDRLVVKVWFRGRTVWIKFVGTHREYDDDDVTQL
jgi:mRNA interferase HigB